MQSTNVSNNSNKTKCKYPHRGKKCELENKSGVVQA